MLLGAVALPAAPSAQSVRDPRVDAIMNGVIQPQEPGASVIVIHDGRILHEAGYGMADLALQRVNTPQSLFHMASAGKQMTAMAIMMMQEQGLLAYDDPIAWHLPELARFGSQATLRQLMHHVSGAPDYYIAPGYNLLLQTYQTPDNDQALAFLRTWGELQQPGVYVYNNTGYDLLGTLIQHASAQSFDAYMQEHVFQPLGMTGSFSLPNPVRFADPNRARGYYQRAGVWYVDDWNPLDDLVGAKSIYTSVRDLYAYDQALYTDQLVSQATLAIAFKPAVLPGGQLLPYGFGWRLGTYSGYAYAGHGGDYEGYRSYILRFANDEFSVYILGNRDDLDPETLAFQIFDVFEPALPYVAPRSVRVLSTPRGLTK
jgi:CubicO group peptidase (beta-lactamase class C family)